MPSQILRHFDKFTTVNNTGGTNDFAYTSAVITVLGSDITFTDPVNSIAVVTFDFADVDYPVTASIGDLQLTIQGWINEYKDSIEDEAGILYLRPTLEQIPVENRLQNIEGLGLHWNGEPVCVGEDCGGGGGTVIPDGTLDRNILVWDETANEGAGGWAEFLSSSALMGPYNFFINQKMDEQSFDLKGFWTAGAGVLELENAFLGIYTDPSNSDQVLGFRMGTSFYEIVDDPASFVKGASLGYHKDNGSAENQWITYYNSASTDPSALGQQTIIFTASDVAIGTRTDLLVTDGVDYPQIEQRIGTESEPTQLTVKLLQDRQVDFREYSALLIDESNVDPDLDYYTKMSLTRQDSSNNEFSIKLSRDTTELLVTGNKEGGSLPNAPVGVNAIQPGCVAMASSGATLNADVNRSVIMCNYDDGYTVSDSGTVYSMGGLVSKITSFSATGTWDGTDPTLYQRHRYFFGEPADATTIVFVVPSHTDFQPGRTFTIKNIKYSPSTGIVQIDPATTSTNIDGITTTFDLNPTDYITIVATDSGWVVVATSL